MRTREHQCGLMERYLDGRATADDVAQLEQELRHDPELRATYLEYANLDSALEACCAHAPAPAPTRRVERGPAWRTVFSVWRLASAAAAVALLIAGVLLLRPAPPRVPPGSPVALEIIKTDGATGFSPGDRRVLSTLNIMSGAVSFRLDSGVVVEASAPTRLSFMSPSELYVHRGKVTAEVTPQGKGFAFRTATARVVDLGTRFGVAVDRVDRTDVAVFDGQVRLYDPSEATGAGSVLAELTKGEGLRVSASGKCRRLTAVALNSSGAGWGNPGNLGIIRSVTDNVEDPAYYQYYGVIPGGLREGAMVYSNRRRIGWQPGGRSAFPAELVGSDLICPPHTYRHERDLRLTLRLEEPATVYVMLDTRRRIPAWLKKEFKDTGWHLRSGPWAESGIVRGLRADARGEFFIEYTVWSRVMRKAGTVELGPPHILGEGGAKAMFGIAVKPLRGPRLALDRHATASVPPEQ